MGLMPIFVKKRVVSPNCIGQALQIMNELIVAELKRSDFATGVSDGKLNDKNYWAYTLDLSIKRQVN